MRRFPVLFILLGLITIAGFVAAGFFTNKAFGSVRNERAFKEALGAYLKEQGYEIGNTGYEMELVDLTGDGTKDALVLLTSPEWCGTGGCTLLVFQGEPGGKAKFVSGTSLVAGPKTISHETTNGWHDLVFEITGEGAKPGYVALKYDGKGYPENASDAPYVKSLKRMTGQVVFDEP